MLVRTREARIESRDRESLTEGCFFPASQYSTRVGRYVLYRIMYSIGTRDIRERHSSMQH